MTDVPSTDDVRDIWVDYHLNPLPRAEGIALVREYQAAFDAWLGTIRADERSYSRTAAGVRRDAEEKWADLRAKVEALPCETDNRTQNDVVERADVLALFDGRTDE